MDDPPVAEGTAGPNGDLQVVWGQDPDDDPEASIRLPSTGFDRSAWGDASTAFIRPGAPSGSCTYNWLFVDPKGPDGTGDPIYYVGIAAHCTGPGQSMNVPGRGRIGEVVFSSFDSGVQLEYGVDRAVDFALVRLDAGMEQNAHPRMMNAEGPSGYATSADVMIGDELAHHGYGMVFGDVPALRDRPGVLVSYNKDYCSESVIWWGDSGGPVLHAETDLALGIVSRAGWTDCIPTSQLRGATLPYIFEELGKTPFAGARLATADGTLADRYFP